MSDQEMKLGAYGIPSLSAGDGDFIQVWDLWELASRLAEGHLAVLSMRWLHDDERGPELYCPVCLATLRRGDHLDDCAWLVSARACGVL